MTKPEVKPGALALAYMQDGGAVGVSRRKLDALADLRALIARAERAEKDREQADAAMLGMMDTIDTLRALLARLAEACDAALDLLGKGAGKVDCGPGSEARTVAKMLRSALAAHREGGAR